MPRAFASPASANAIRLLPMRRLYSDRQWADPPDCPIAGGSRGIMNPVQRLAETAMGVLTAVTISRARTWVTHK